MVRLRQIQRPVRVGAGVIVSEVVGLDAVQVEEGVVVWRRAESDVAALGRRRWLLLHAVQSKRRAHRSRAKGWCTLRSGMLETE